MGLDLVKMEGRLLEAYTIRCGRCGREATVYAIGSRACEDVLRMRGWKRLEKAGWVCWGCIEEETEVMDASED